MNTKTAQTMFLSGVAAFLFSLACLVFGFLDLRYHRVVIENIDRTDRVHIQSHEKTIQLVKKEMVLGMFEIGRAHV